MSDDLKAEGANRIIAFVQARMASTRLPGKVLADVAGVPMLIRVVTRARRANSLDGVVVATSDANENDAIAEACQAHGIDCFRGDETDVLDRFAQAARAFKADVIVRITGDCPMIDPLLIDQTVQAMQGAGARFAANRLPGDRSFPVGLDVEVCTFDALDEAWRRADQPYEREHVMPYLYQGTPADDVVLVRNEEDLSHMRWTVDEPSDLELVRRIYDAFNGRDDFAWREVLALVNSDPSLTAINAHVRHRGLEKSG